MEEEKKKNILSHIDKIEQYTHMPGNEWLLHELQRRFGNNSSNPDIQRIEKYLALDYTIDSISECIDYSFVADDVLRMKLESDWREMLRYRCNVRKHEPDFMEFCRYANLQAEGIINYYCSCKYPTEDELRAACNEKEPYTAYELKENDKISYLNKLRLLQHTEVIRNSDTDILYNKIYAVRNLQSHRVGTTLSDYLEQTRPLLTELIKKLNLPTSKEDDTLINTWLISNPETKAAYKQFNQQLKVYKIDYNRYKALIWCKKTPYKEVEQTIEKLVSCIKNKLLYHHETQ